MKSKYLIGLLIMIVFISGCIHQIEKAPETVEKEEIEKLFVSFKFVEGDNISWIIQPSKIGKRVLSPSYFRFNYITKEGENPSLICSQFERLKEAVNLISPLSVIVKENVKISENYSIILNEKGMEETMAEINVAFSPSFPSNSVVIYKYELVEELPAEELKKTTEKKPQEETLTQEQEEIIEFLEAEDEQFDYPAVNRILADFRSNYFYYIPGSINSFTDKEVRGVLHFDMDLRNLQDESGEPVVGLGATFTTDLVASNWKKDDTIKISPPSYVFSYDDVPQEEVYIGGGFRPSPYVEFNEPILFTPGFDAFRSADKTVFSGQGTQILTITVIPREKDIWEKGDGFGMCIYTIEPGAENLVDVIITSPTTDGEHFVVSEDRHSLRIYDIFVKTDTVWNVNLTLKVTPKPGVSKVKFLPFVSFLWNPASFRDDPSAVSCVMESGNSGSKGTIEGSSVSCVADTGVAKWKARGNYIWDWQAGLCAYAVMFEHLQERVEDE